MNKTEFVDAGEILQKITTDTYIATCNGIKYEIKKYITLQNQYDFVKTLISTAQISEKIQDGNNGSSYSPSMFEFSLRYCLVKFFTNIKIPKKQEDINKLLFMTDITQQICDNAEYQFLAIAARQEIERTHNEMLTAISLTRESPIDKILKPIGAFLDKIKDAPLGDGSTKLIDILDSTLSSLTATEKSVAAGGTNHVENESGADKLVQFKNMK